MRELRLDPNKLLEEAGNNPIRDPSESIKQDISIGSYIKEKKRVLTPSST